MSGMSHLQTLERYHEHRNAIEDLLTSILDGIGDSAGELAPAVDAAAERYPFLELVYTLDDTGRQTSANLAPGKRHGSGKGADRSRRPYFQLIRDGAERAVTSPYLSTADQHLCLTAIRPRSDGDGYLVVDADLAAIVAFLMGDSARRRFQPAFRAVYTLIGVGLLAVVALLLALAIRELAGFLPAAMGPAEEAHLKPFSVIVFLTLALAVFDLAKTILEEEVLTPKDIFRHSSTRRTITRFVAAILIAVSIEALLLMFKAALADGEGMFAAVAMMGTVVGLLIGLGVYVFLGSQAEVRLLEQARQERERGDRGAS